MFKTQILLLVILESKRPQETPRVNRVFRQQWRPSNWFCWRLLSARWGCTCLVAQPSLTLCIPMDCSPLDSSVHGISQARILEWVAISSSRGSSPPRDRTWIFCVSWIGGQILSHWATHEAQDGVTDLIFEFIWLHSHSSLDSVHSSVHSKCSFKSLAQLLKNSLAWVLKGFFSLILFSFSFY